MSKKLIAKLRKDRDEYIRTAEELAARLEEGEELSDTEGQTLADCRREAGTLNERIGELQEQETARLRAGMRDAEFDQLVEQAAAGAEGRAHTKDRPKSVGQRFLESDAYRVGKASKGRGGGDFTVEFALISSIDGGGKQVAPIYRAADAALPTRSTPLLDACGYETVSANAFDWIEWPLTAPLAGVVAEGAAKPEATYAPAVKNGTLEKLAHRIPITDEFLEDNARMEGIVSGALMDGVRDKAEAQAAAVIAAATLPTAEHENLLKAVRMGIAQVQMSGFRPGTVVLNPMDYGEIDIELLTSTLNGARRESPVWGLTVVPASAVAAGTAYVGDFTAGVTVFARSEVQLSMTDSNADDWTKNIIQLRAEQRVKTVVTRPEAVVKVTAAVTP